ncbi:hypothetical protein CAPN001_19010 [Capnocytophaga stomatis]|uniref:DUF4837 family protein n=1 Tax=Capnocytophaga stomatis TaxID=1848904 RepID=UPI0019515453|nr:DUF4837 family protein [Capnocytophaga stomatis]GIJ92852.1 hypothetical protein CAPN002_00700 [Capnocytophaga stomatis]GIJ97332.1 hypothetical protein CAPN001_19010 [Capnocytophaga stomatis]
MKRLVLFIIGAFLLISCQNTSNKNKNNGEIYLPQSNGQINSLAVVIDNTLWKGSVGDTIRKYFASPVDGLSTEEPIFSLHQIPPQIFTDNTRNSRNILIIEKDSINNVVIKENLFAKPQRIGVIRGRTNRDITCEIQEHFAKIVREFKENDIAENQLRFRKSLNKEKDIEEKLGFKLTMPSVYKIVKKENNFFWIERQIKGGTANIIIYEMPPNSIPEGDARPETIVKMRDSIGKRYIPGREEGMYMVSESAFAPSIYNTTIKDRKAIESKGLWEVKNFLLGGPYINYIIEDKPNNRLVVVEGFVSAPMTEKRDHLFELESIIKSITFVK